MIRLSLSPKQNVLTGGNLSSCNMMISIWKASALICGQWFWLNATIFSSFSCSIHYSISLLYGSSSSATRPSLRFSCENGKSPFSPAWSCLEQETSTRSFHDQKKEQIEIGTALTTFSWRTDVILFQKYCFNSKWNKEIIEKKSWRIPFKK